MSDEPVSIYSAENSIEASFILQLLAEAGIEGRIASNALEAVSGEVPYRLVSVPIWVHRSDSESAQRVIRDHQVRLGRQQM
jgi:hypothetical protein